MLTETEAVTFVKDILGIPRIQEAIRHDRLAALNALLYPYQQHVAPFQNVTLLAAPINSTTTPTTEQVRSAILTKQGGLCFELNCFMGELLRALGYTIVWAQCNIYKYPGNHLAVIVTDVCHPGDR